MVFDNSRGGILMKYISTRGGVEPQPFCNILLGGLAPGGGLYLPERYPGVTLKMLREWSHLSFVDLAFQLLVRFIDDIPPQDLHRMCRETFTAETYRYCRKGCNPEDITPLVTLEPRLYLLELSNGPTLAFKDMAMQLLGRLFEYVLNKRGETLNILGATSGDTGSAAIYAMLGKKGIKVFMLSPEGKMSPFQRAQMYSVLDPDIHNLAVRGMFDDAQDIVKAISNDAEFKAKYKIGAVNSINWARVMTQVVYYFKGYFATIQREGLPVGSPVEFVIPTGNFGNICAGHIARMMGLPIRRLVLATNENDVLADFFHTGVYRPRPSAETSVTSSPSMDSSKASNFELFIYDLVGRDPQMVREMWHILDQSGKFNMGGSYNWERIKDDFGIVSGTSTHQDRIEMIRDVYARYIVLIDPHTADAVKVALEHRDPNVPMIVLETAQPMKFEETVREAIGKDPERHPDFVGIENREKRVVIVPASSTEVEAYIRDNA